MKEQKGMGHITLILCIILIALALIGTANIVRIKLQEERKQDYETDMLLIQGKVKVMSQESTIQKNEELLKGKKLSDNLEDEEIKKLLEENIISQDEESFSKYYIMDKSNLEEIGLKNIETIDGNYIVNYGTYEIIYTKGIKIGEDTYYKLTQLQELKEQDDENIINENETNDVESINDLQDEKQD